MLAQHRRGSPAGLKAGCPYELVATAGGIAVIFVMGLLFKGSYHGVRSA